MRQFRSFLDWRGAVGFVLIASIATVVLTKVFHVDLGIAAACSVIGLLLVGASTFFEDD